MDMSELKELIELFEQSSVAEMEFPTVGRKTASFGVATYRMSDKNEEVVKRADSALYQAKEGGRNRVVAEQ